MRKPIYGPDSKPVERQRKLPRIRSYGVVVRRWLHMNSRVITSVSTMVMAASAVFRCSSDVFSYSPQVAFERHLFFFEEERVPENFPFDLDEDKGLLALFGPGTTDDDSAKQTSGADSQSETGSGATIPSSVVQSSAQETNSKLEGTGQLEGEYLLSRRGGRAKAVESQDYVFAPTTAETGYCGI